MPPNAAERRQKERQAKKKKLLFVLVPVLVLVLALTVPRMLKQLRGSEAAPPPSTPAATTEAGATTPAEGGAAPAAPSTPVPSDPTAVAASAKEVLEETDAPPDPDEGQLVSFTRFEARDPFVQLVDDQPEDTSTTDQSGAAPTPATPAGTPPPSTTPTPTTPPPTDNTTGGSTQPTQVKISVNGRVSAVDVGDTFPEDDPAFEIVAIRSDSIEVGLVSGSFATGVQTITVKVGEPVTLISQPDGARYTIKFIGPA